MSLAGIDYHPVNVFDLEPKFRSYYDGIQACGRSPCEDGHFGPIEGDLLKVDLASLANSDVLVAGPPCNPWAGNGPREGEGDPRSLVFLRVIDWVIALALHGSLWAFAIENSPKISERLKGRTPFVEVALTRLQTKLTEFVIDVVTSDLVLFLPHRRQRCWIRGVRRSLLPSGVLPAPISRFGDGPVLIRKLLTPGLGNVYPWTLTPKRQQNLEAYVDAILDRVAADVALLGDVAVIDVDRAFDSVFPSVLSFGVVPTLRTKGPELFLISVWDLSNPVGQRSFFRFLSEGERFLLLGHRAEYALYTQKVFGRLMTGNAFAVPMLASVIAPILNLMPCDGEEGCPQQPAKRIRLDA